MRGMSDRARSEYIGLLEQARALVAKAIEADDPMHARQAILDAREHLGMADNRVAHLATPPHSRRLV